MAAEASALGELIKTNVDSKFSGINGVSPLGQNNPAYFTEMCISIAKGIALGGPSINFVTLDTGFMGAPPVPGAGSGIGIFIDDQYFVQKLYTELRSEILSTFGNSTHEAFPPGSSNTSGQYLKALCEGIATALKTHFQTAWILTSVHPLIYSGTGIISNGSFSGLVPKNIEDLILAESPSLKGSFWPIIAKKVAEVYVDTIHNHSTSLVTIIGVCIPLVPPAGLQVCGIPSSGAGTGVAS